MWTVRTAVGAKPWNRTLERHKARVKIRTCKACDFPLTEWLSDGQQNKALSATILEINLET